MSIVSWRCAHYRGKVGMSVVGDGRVCVGEYHSSIFVRHDAEVDAIGKNVRVA